MILFRQNSPVLVFVLINYLMLSMKNTIKNFLLLPWSRKSRLTLFELMASSKRYKYLKAFAYVNDYQIDLQQQFAAVSYHLDRDTVLTCFRGTDDTIIGWKEDFHIDLYEGNSCTTICQSLFAGYHGSQHSDFYVSGHSKGGNLAIYATSQLPPTLQQYILIVYAFDAPGLHKQYLTSDGYLGIEQKIVPIIPQNSIVGMMLETPEKAQIVTQAQSVYYNTSAFLGR